MLEYLKELDTRILLLVNGANSSFFDFIMYWLSDKLIWIPLYVFLIWRLYRSYGKKIWIILLFAAFAIILSDWGSVQVFKNTVQRLRPCHEPALEGLLHLVNGKCGGQYGFISSHAANTFGLALYCLPFFKDTNKKWLVYFLVIWATIVSFSRIYLGVHYPGDVLAGAIWGCLAGTAMALCAGRFIKFGPQ